MYLFLLKKALPFTLTFIFGAVLSGLAGLFWTSERSSRSFLSTRPNDCGGLSRMRCHHLVAETTPLNILYQPDAWLPRGALAGMGDERKALVSVTFGADGKVQEVKPLKTSNDARDESLIEVREAWEAVEHAARSIRFMPETVNGVPTTVTRDVEIRFTTY